MKLSPVVDKKWLSLRRAGEPRRRRAVTAERRLWPSSCGTVRRGDAPRPELQVKSLAAHVDEVAGGTSAGAKPLCEHERLVEVQKQVQFAPAELILSVGALQQRDVLLHLLLGALRAVVAERTREQLPQVAPRRARQPVLLSEARVRHTTRPKRIVNCFWKP